MFNDISFVFVYKYRNLELGILFFKIRVLYLVLFFFELIKKIYISSIMCVSDVY